MKSKIGNVLVLLYVLFCLFLFTISGSVVGGSVYASLIAGIPWSFVVLHMIFSGEAGGSILSSSTLAYALAIVPLILNVIILYFIGLGITKMLNRTDQGRSV